MRLHIDFESSVNGVEIESVSFRLEKGQVITPFWDDCSGTNTSFDAWIRKTDYHGQYSNLTLDDLRNAKVTEISISTENGAPINSFHITGIRFESYGNTLSLDDVSCDRIMKTWCIPVEWVIKHSASIQISAASFEEALALLSSDAHKRLFNRKSELTSYAINGVECVMNPTVEQCEKSESKTNPAAQLPKSLL